MVPRTMSTQHPDNVRQPFFVNNSVIAGDEEIKEAAIRETFEETKIELDATKVRFLSAFPAHGGGVFYDYVCEIEEEVEPTIDEEHSEWGYFGINEIPTPITDEMKNDVKLALGN